MNSRSSTNHMKDKHKENYTQRIIFKHLENNDKKTILKVIRGKKYIIFKGAKVRLRADFSIETMESRRQCNDVFKVLKERNCQPRILYSQKKSIGKECEREKKHFKTNKGRGNLFLADLH